jgi:hypothetical protein
MVGMGALLLGAVLLSTGVAVSARTVPLAVGASKKTTTTTSTIPTTTTTTLEPCTATSGTSTAVPPDGTGTLTVNPATCLLNGTSVAISATGLVKKTLGTILECNSDPGQPTASLLGHAIPVSCTAALAASFTTSSAGSYSGNFSVVEGVTGPPLQGPDSTGGDAATDAVNYPCPPTPAQVTAGDVCVIAVGDEGGDQVTVPISFNPNIAPPPATKNTVPPSSSSGGAGATTVPPAAAASTSTHSSSLAFTGTGPGLWWLALVGLLLMVFGGLLLTIVDQPRRLLRLVLHRATRSRDS